MYLKDRAHVRVGDCDYGALLGCVANVRVTKQTRDGGAYVINEAIKKILTQLPPLYSQEHEKDPILFVKFFTPDAQWTWWAWEYDPKDQIFFGLVDGLEVEMGYFSLAELQEIRGVLGLPVERDRYFSPCRLSEVKARLTAEGKRVWC